jgi:hypothetical protein
MLTPPDLLAAIGRALHGEAYKAPLARDLDMRPDSIDAMSKGTSRVPPGLWRDLWRLLDRRRANLVDLMAEVDRASPGADRHPSSSRSNQ